MSAAAKRLIDALLADIPVPKPVQAGLGFWIAFKSDDVARLYGGDRNAALDAIYALRKYAKGCAGWAFEAKASSDCLRAHSRNARKVYRLFYVPAQERCTLPEFKWDPDVERALPRPKSFALAAMMGDQLAGGWRERVGGASL
jgi:hypothetical protein